MSLQCLPLPQSRPLSFSGNRSATRSGLLPEYPPGRRHNLESDPESDQHFHFAPCGTPVELYENTISPVYRRPHPSTPFDLSGDFQADDKDASSEPTSSHKEDEAWADYIDSSGEMVSLSGKNPGHITNIYSSHLIAGRQRPRARTLVMSFLLHAAAWRPTCFSRLHGARK